MIRKSLLCGISLSLYIFQLSLADASKRPFEEDDTSNKTSTSGFIPNSDITPLLKKRRIEVMDPSSSAVENTENSIPFSKSETTGIKRKLVTNPESLIEEEEGDAVPEEDYMPPKKKIRLPSKEDICEEIVTIMFPKDADLEPGEQESFKKSIQLYAKDYPFLFIPSYFEQILEISRAHAPSCTTHENAQNRKELVSDFMDALASLSDTVEELKVKEYTETMVQNVFLNVESEEPESLTPLKSQFLRDLKRPVKSLLAQADERFFKALSSHYSIAAQKIEEYDIKKYLTTLVSLLSSSRNLSTDDLSKLLVRLQSSTENEDAPDKKTEVAKKILKDLQWEHKEEKHTARQRVYADFTTKMEPPKADDITAHMMWIYNQPGDQPTVFPLHYEREGKTINSLEVINEWAKDFKVTVFYNSHPITNHEEALENTREKIANLPNGARAQLVDIQSLPTIQQNKDIFQNTYMDVYFLSDLGRMAATYDTLLQNLDKPFYFLYADFKMPPMSYEKLIDPETIYNLNTYSIALARGGHLGFENGFHLAGSQNKNLLTALKLGVIDLNLAMARDPECKRGLTQVVYDNLPKMFRAFYALEQKATLTYDQESFDQVVVDKIHTREDLYKWFSPALTTGSMPSAYLQFKMINEKFPELSKEDTIVISGPVCAGGVAIPTKFDRFPPSHFG